MLNKMRFESSRIAVAQLVEQIAKFQETSLGHSLLRPENSRKSGDHEGTLWVKFKRPQFTLYLDDSNK